MNLSGHSEIHLRDYLYILRKRRTVIVFFSIFLLVASFVYTYYEAVLYKASATILIERENPNVVDFKEVMSLDASSTDYYQTQHQMLKSRSLALELIEEEKLLQDPYFAGMIKGKTRARLKGQPFVPAWIKDFLKEPAPEDVFIKAVLRVEPVRNSRLVEVGIIHPDPARAAHIANRLIELFIRRNIQDRFQISKTANDLISAQLAELKTRVAAAERRLFDYKEEKNLINIPDIREKDQFLKDAKLELVKIQAEQSKLAKRYLPAHPKMIHISSQIEGLQNKIDEEEKKTLGYSRVAIDYGELEREAESARQVYKSLLARLEQTNTEAQTQASNIMFVDKASAPLQPYRPKPFLNILTALFLGVVGGVSLAFFLEYLDSSIKIPEDIEVGLGLELLGIIPSASGGKKGQGRIFISKSQHSPAAESIRALRTALLFRLRAVEGARTILITSPNPEEGKSTIAVNLAAAFHQNHLKVLIIDADLRKPRLHKIFETPAQPGLTDILEGQISFKETVVSNPLDMGMDFLPAGTPSHHPTEILGTRAMREMLKKLRQEYDIILMDSPPYLAVADVNVISEYASAMVVVARYQSTDKRHLHDLKRRFRDYASQVMGVVINQVSVKQKDYYYQQYYYYGYGDAEVKK